MRRYLLIATVAALLAVPAWAFGGSATTVDVSDNFFNPQNVTKHVGAGGISWQWDGLGKHNVREDNKLFYSGMATKAPHTFTVIPSAGSFHYYCEVHKLVGMQGRILIRPLILNKTANSFDVEWAPGTSNTGGKFDVRYRVDGGPWNMWKNDVTITQARFGLNNRPVHVSAGHTYDIQARSEKTTDTTKTSGWATARAQY